MVILSRNDPVSGMRVFRSAKHYGLPIQRGVFTRGESPWRYLKPLPAGPFKPLLEALQLLQRQASPAMRVRTALVTARSAPAHERAIRTLMDWHIEIDEAMFLGGLPKGEFLREFEPDFFFDDQTGHIENASAHVPSGHVAAGVSNLIAQVAAVQAER